jgi:hypothetical protein
MQQLRTRHRIRLPPLAEIRTYWLGRTIPPIEKERFTPKALRRTRKQWLQAIASDDWPLVKPDLVERGDPDSPLIRTLIHDHEYRRMYIDYLIMKGIEPTPLLLQTLGWFGHVDIAQEIMESVIIDSTDL